MCGSVYALLLHRISSFHLQGSSKVIENYIHHNIPATQYASADDMINNVEKMCKKVHDQMVEIFDHPDVVMTTFVQAVIDRVLLVGA